VFEGLLAAQGPDPAVLANLAAALRELERPQEVLRLTAEAAKRHPQHAELQLNRAIAQLTLGDLPAGWEGFEWRWHAWSGKAAPWERWPRWRGEPLPQGSVLLVGEQGLGDSIQLLRYLPLVAARVREVILVLQPPLVALAQGLAPNCRVLALDGPVPNADCQCPLMSLPHVFGTTLASLPADVPYLHAEAQRVQTWRARLPANDRPRAGIVWSGNPSHGNDRNRSIPLQIFQGIDPGNVQFVALQPQVRESDRAALAAWTGLFDAGPQLRDFGETAALLEALDLVVTVDTSVAHLAGALGRPVWMLLPFAPDWRWMLERADTPWYPTMRLYRQRKPGDWSQIVAQVQRDLQSFQPPRQ
jgi:hypothetical protein